MPLTEREVVPGAVAYFDHALLLAEPDIESNEDGLNRPGPFVCVEVIGEESVWCAITSEYRRERLELDPLWIIGGSARWRSKPAYLLDGLNTYLGPTAAFLRAAAGERPFSPFTRPVLTSDGVSAVLAEIRAQGGPLLSGGSQTPTCEQPG